MDYFKRLQELLLIEKEEDRRSFEQLTERLPITERRENGMTWYPIAIKDTELGRGDYLVVEIERTTHHDINHQFRFGMTAALFSQHDPQIDRLEGTITYVSGNRLKISLRTDELPDWSRNGKLGIDALFDKNSYEEMERALKSAPTLAEKKEDGKLIQVLTGTREATFQQLPASTVSSRLNSSQQEAVIKILAANELAIVHGPPGTGKTTTLVQAIKALKHRDHKQLLVVAPSNAAVDLLSEKLSDEGLNVLRVGNPARVSEKQLNLTLDHKMNAHSSMKEIRKLKKRAAEFRDMAQKYKRNFGKEEREQRKALYAEARDIIKDVERTEQYIAEDLISKADVITATMVGANHYTVRHLKFETVVIDEAGQALEPACWIPVLKAQKVVMAGDHCQLPPTIKSAQAAREGLSKTLMEKCVALHPNVVVLLDEQYRMNEKIMGFSSQEFYDNRVKAHPSIANHLLFESDLPLNFIDTAGCGFEEIWEGNSISNPEEASFLVKHLANFITEIHAHLLQFPSVAVISPYRHQVELLKQYVQDATVLHDALPFITVNTIDSFQGQERDIVYISMTRSNTENNIGFLSDIRRMNVAMTRARKKLVVIGDSATLSQLSFYEGFITYAQAFDSYQSAWEFMD
jgi:superfamily I DNA and/or RNA helicase